MNSEQWGKLGVQISGSAVSTVGGKISLKYGGLKGLRDTISIMEDMASDINSGMDNLQQTVDRIATF